MKIYPIVEGHGEVRAVPVLLRRLLAEAQCFGVEVGRPILRTQAQFRSKVEVEKAVRLALFHPDCAAVVILFDGEDDCPKDVADKARAWARGAAGQIPCDVVVAYREYETWLLSAVESLHGECGISNVATAPDNPESRRDAKGALEEFMPVRRAYSETLDQPAMSAVFDMGMAHRRSRSFQKLVKAVGEVLAQLKQPVPTWPPTKWRDVGAR
ncbi:MAG TPA: hypothetical protein DCM05_13205 [Elusimicrobia bacterium]|nr:hypothetical protein [Elusimicrobiota bacterium]